MSNFLRDLAIAKFPRFGITYYIQLDASSEPEIHGGSCKVPLKFYDGKTTPPQHLTDKAIKLPIWKWGEFMDIVEAEMFGDVQHIVAVELTKRRAEDEYGNLQVRLDKQVTLDANLRDAPQPQPEQAGPSKPAAANGGFATDQTQQAAGKEQPIVVGANNTQGDSSVLAQRDSERGQPQAGGLSQDAVDEIGIHYVHDEPPAACPLPDTHTGPVKHHAASEDTFEGFYCEACGERVA